jgi:site-specific recombinase XerD
MSLPILTLFELHAGRRRASRQIARRALAHAQADDNAPALVGHVRDGRPWHTAATLLLAQGVDPRTLMKTLGYSQISLTLNTHSHVDSAVEGSPMTWMPAVY